MPTPRNTKHRVIFITPTLGIAKALARYTADTWSDQHVRHEVTIPVLGGTSHAQSRERAKRIYEMYARGLSGREVGQALGVSVQTVSRVVLDPKRYGIKGKPLRRSSPVRK